MIWKKYGVFFTNYGGVVGVSPAEGGSGKAVGFEAWGKAFPLFIFRNDLFGTRKTIRQRAPLSFLVFDVILVQSQFF
jgi:hypothetical protein